MEEKRINKYFRLSRGEEKRFFREKYGTTNPIARIDQALNLDLEYVVDFNEYINETLAKMLESRHLFEPCVFNYWVRAKHENLPLKGLFFYGHIQNMGEIIHSSEIGEKVTEKDYYNRFHDKVNQILACVVYDEIPKYAN